MNKIIKSFIFAVLVTSSVSAFAVSKKSIVCENFPSYDWVKNIVGDSKSFDVTLLQNNGTDLHSYQPSIKDIAKISNADMFVFVGGESDKWVEKSLSNAKNKNMVVVNLLETLGDKVKEEEIVEGMETEEKEGEEEETEYDEHVWLSLKNAIFLVNELSSKIQTLDSANSSVYKKNTKLYTENLSALDSEYEKVAKSAKTKTVLFGDRFPFRYLTDDYNLKYFAAFVGCSAESEASFKTIAFLSKKVDELGLNAVLTIERGDKKIAKTIISNTKTKNQQILEMDSLQSVTEKDIKNGRNYFSAMKNNLEVLKKALK